MNNPTQYTAFSQGPKKSSLNDLETMLDLLPGAALLVDVQNLHILTGNTGALGLTGYARPELAGLTLAKLFPYEERTVWSEKAESGNAYQTTLQRRNHSFVLTQLSRINLSTQSKLSIYMLVETQALEHQRLEQERREGLLRSMQILSQAFQARDLDSALNQFLEGARIITGARLLSIYLQQISPYSNEPEITRAAHNGPLDLLPASLPANEWLCFRNAHLWSAGKRPSTSLHRAGRAAGLNHILTIPLGQPHALIGFLLIAGDLAAPGDHLLHQAKPLGTSASSLIALHSQLAHLAQALEAEKMHANFQHVIEDTVKDGAITLGPDLKILRLNRAAEQMLGYTSLEAHTHPVEHILISSSGLGKAYELAQQGETATIEEDFYLYRRSGQSFRARVQIIPAFHQQTLVGIIILFEDLSEQLQIQAQAQQLEQQATLGEVTAIFAHEVRNPINNISTGLQVMAMNLAAQDPNQELVARLQQDCERLNELMKSVLAFSRPSDYPMEKVDVGALVTRLVERQRARMQKANVKAHIEIKPRTPVVLGNPRALEQVFLNLITNATQALSEKGGTVAIKVQPVERGGETRFVEIDIADNGPGIPKELQERLFRPFFTTKPDGTGLGLAITKRIVTAHRGNIKVNSFPGGTIFQVQLPAKESV